MADDFEAFIRRMHQRSLDLEAGVDRIVRKVALMAHREVTYATPVDTGRARANWQTSLDAPIESPIESTDIGASVSQAESVISRFGSEANKSIVLSNNLPYIVPLNEGHSAQAPAGFVELAVERASAAITGESVLKS